MMYGKKKYFRKGRDNSMKINALIMNTEDNVATCVKDVEAGTTVYYRKDAEVKSITAEERIPYCHKIALQDVEKGQDIIKYGESIGKTLSAIKKGHWVSDKNITSVPRDYETELLEL